MFLTGRALYGARVGFWSAIVFDTLPLIAFIAASVTTDAPLLLFWSIALYFWTMLLERKSMALASSLGLTSPSRIADLQRSLPAASTWVFPSQHGVQPPVAVLLH